MLAGQRRVAAEAARCLMAHGSANLHTVFTSECNNKQFDWFTVGVYESFRTSGMQGSITRLLACTPEDLAKYQGLDLGPTFVHPNYRHNPLNGDTSASYNKPASVMHFSREANFTEEFVLFIDADMLLTRPIDPVALGAKKGTVVSEYVPYMVGTSNEMAANFLPEYAVPRAKPVGWYHIFHRDDLKRIAPLWLEYCGRVRMEPQRYWSINGSIPQNVSTGDAYVKFGHAPWISEMYGYAFGAAMAGVQHVITHGNVRYPGEVANSRAPEHFILHYGIDFTIDATYNWNKMSYQKLDLYTCKALFFGPPPAGDGGARHQAMRFVVNTLNAAFCDFYHTHCPDTLAATVRCPPATRPILAPCTEGEPDCCRDQQHTCWQWALDEQCEVNKAFMEGACKASCGQCPAVTAPVDPALARLSRSLTRLQSVGVAVSPSPPPAAHVAPEDGGGAAAMAAGAQEAEGGVQAIAIPMRHNSTDGVTQGHVDHPGEGHEPSMHAGQVAPRHAHTAPVHAPKSTRHAPITHAASKTTAAPTGHDLHPALHRELHAPGGAPVLHSPAGGTRLPAGTSEERSPGLLPVHSPTLSTAHLPGHLPAHLPGYLPAHSPVKSPLPLQEEFRMIADQHRGLYAPGHVPEWLERHAVKDWHAPSPVGGRGGMHQQIGPSAHTVAAAAAEARAQEQDHFLLLVSCGAIWLSAIALVAVRWLRLCSGRRIKRRRSGEPRVDLLHRF